LLTIGYDPTEVLSDTGTTVETLKDAPELTALFKTDDVSFALEYAGDDQTDGGCPFVMGLIKAVRDLKDSDTHGWGIPMHVRLAAVVAVAQALGLKVSAAGSKP
jgi:hypothetical protein